VVGKEGGTNPLGRLREFAHLHICFVKHVTRTAFRTFPSIDVQDCPALHGLREAIKVAETQRDWFVDNPLRLGLKLVTLSIRGMIVYQ
jgi:hypothetical protein